MKNDNYMLIIKPNSAEIERIDLISPEFSELLHDKIGGYFELVPYFNTINDRRCVVFCDTDGKNKGLPYNALAQHLWERSYGKLIFEDHLVGNIVVIVGTESFLSEL